MKKILILFIISVWTTIAQAQNFELSTLRMGDLKLFMSLTELKGFTTNKLKVPTEKNEYNGDNHIMYHGESVLVTLTTHYEGENATTDYKI